MRKTFLILATLTFTMSAMAQIPSKGLVGYWPFTKNGEDQSGNANHATISNAVFCSDRFSNDSSAFNFDGISSYIMIPDNPLYAFDTLDFAVSLWVNLLSQAGGNVFYGAIIIKSQLAAPYEGFTIFADFPSPGQLTYRTTYYEQLTPSYAIEYNQWYHLLLQRKDNHLQLFINGELKGDYVVQKTNCSNNQPIWLGCNHANPSLQNLSGKLDDLCIWNRALTQSEINQLYTGVDLSTSSTTFVTACDSYTAADGAVYDTSGIYTAVIPNAAGSDSTITINLTINTVDVSVTQNGITLSANATADLYQWLDCNNGNSMISGETNRSFTATQNGNYAVKLTQNECTDTSACYAVTTFGILENTFSNEITVHPNPTDGIVKIDLGETISEFIVCLNDVNGKLIRQSTYKNTKMFKLNLNVLPGIYLLSINSGNKKATIRLIKN